MCTWPLSLHSLALESLPTTIFPMMVWLCVFARSVPIKIKFQLCLPGFSAELNRIWLSQTSQLFTFTYCHLSLSLIIWSPKRKKYLLSSLAPTSCKEVLVLFPLLNNGIYSSMIERCSIDRDRDFLLLRQCVNFSDQNNICLIVANLIELNEILTVVNMVRIPEHMWIESDPGWDEWIESKGYYSLQFRLSIIHADRVVKKVGRW